MWLQHPLSSKWYLGSFPFFLEKFWTTYLQDSYEIPHFLPTNPRKRWVLHDSLYQKNSSKLFFTGFDTTLLNLSLLYNLVVVNLCCIALFSSPWPPFWIITNSNIQ